MNLLSIKISNFKCFKGDFEIDLATNSTWVIQGKNGSGKSSLICDSLMFAFFGTTQATIGTGSLNPVDLINVDSSEMQITIRFTHHMANYLLIRSLTRKKKYQFECQINDSLAIKTTKIKEANDWVEQNLWKPSDFQNTSIILQNEIISSLHFTAGERKKIVESIFKIERFTRMAELVHQDLKNVKTNLKELDQEIHILNQVIAPVLEQQSKSKELEQLIRTTEDRLPVIIKKITEYEERERLINDDIARFKQVEKNLKELEDALKTETKNYTLFIKDLQHIDALLGTDGVLRKQLSEVEGLEQQLAINKEIKSELELLNSQEKYLLQKIKNEEDSLNNSQALLKKEKTGLLESIKNTQKQLDELQKLKTDRFPEVIKDLWKIPQIQMEIQDLEKTYENGKKISFSIEKKVEQLRQQENDLKNAIKELENYEKEKLSVQELLNKKNQEISSYDHIHVSIQSYIRDVESLNKDLSINDVDIHQEETNVVQIKKSIHELEGQFKDYKQLKSGTLCPKCHQLLHEEHLKTLLQATEEQLSDHHHHLATLNKNIQELTLKKTSIQDKISSINKELVELKAKYQEKADMEKTILELQNKLTQLETLSKSVLRRKNELESQLHTHTLVEEIHILQQQLPDLVLVQKKLQNVRLQEKLYITQDVEKQRIEKELEKIPSLEQTLKRSSDNLEKIQQKMVSLTNKLQNKDYAQHEKTQLETIREHITQKKTELTKNKELESKLNELNPIEIRNKLEELVQYKQKREILINQMSQLEKNITALKTKQTLLNNQIKDMSLDTLVNTKNTIHASIKQLQSEYGSLQQLVGEYQGTFKVLQDSIKKNFALNTDLVLKTNLQTELKEKVANYDLLETTFKLIGKRILSRLLELINTSSKEFLTVLGNDQLQQITLTETSTGFELNILTNRSEEYGFNWFSAGQKVRIGLAFRLALSKALATVVGSDLETIIIDEGDFGVLDEEGIKGISEVFNKIQAYFKRIILITHLPVLARQINGSIIDLTQIQNYSYVPKKI